jgi:hypothetical protein
MPQNCFWLFGRGASIANGISWVVPDIWKNDLIDGRVSREQHIDMIIDKMRKEMQSDKIHTISYQKLLNFMANRTINKGCHSLITTNWDYLLQIEVDRWIETNQPGNSPKFLKTNSSVLHLNGTIEPNCCLNRSPFLLETDNADYRRNSIEANIAFNMLLWSKLVVIVGMSFECDIDKGLLAALYVHQDNIPLGEALFIVVDPCLDTLDKTGKKLKLCFPESNQILVNCGLEEWIDLNMPELCGQIFNDITTI